MWTTVQLASETQRPNVNAGKAGAIQGRAINGPHESRRKLRAGGWNGARYLPLGLIAAGFTLGYALGWHESLSLQSFAGNAGTLKQLAADNPVSGPLAFIIVYVLAAAFAFPAVAVLKVIGGFLFGWLAGALYVIVAATAGGAILFLAARTAFGGFIREAVRTRGAGIAHEFERDAFSYVMVLRLIPFIPFFMASVAPALFDIRFRTYLAATLTGLLPGTLCFAWLGQELDIIIESAKAAGRQITLADFLTPQIMLVFLALTLVAALAMIVRRVQGRRRSSIHRMQ